MREYFKELAMRTAEKYDAENNEWVESTFLDLKNGDLFRFFDDDKRYVNSNDDSNAWMICGEPYINDDGIPQCSVQKSFIEIIV